MALRKQDMQLITTLLLICLHTSTSKSTKPNARPVHEVINEQSRMDDKPRFQPGSLPYGNPLAGNSQQNARLHAQNQQAMFNAERIRQHRAQLQRWTKAPQQIDSYMKAYQESQENHQLALEQQQSIRNEKPTGPVTSPTKQETKRGGKSRTPELTKITKADAVIKGDKNRNHRSYGSVEYQQHLEPKRYQTVYVSPAPTYDQGVTIKPNGNVGITHIQHLKNEPSKLYTEAIPSKSQHGYPKQYSQTHTYQSAHDIDTLTSMLKKTPQEQLTDFNAIINSAKLTEDNTKDLNTPIDLYFYLKDPMSLSQYYNNQNSAYAQIPQNYANAYSSEVTETKDHTPITEEVDDIEDPNKKPKIKAHLQAILPTNPPELSTTTLKTNNYYKVEVASQTISSGLKNNEDQQTQYYAEQQENKPVYQALQYAQPLKYYLQKETQADLNEKYLHHNLDFKGIHHLNDDDDDTGVTAFADENVSTACLDDNNSNNSAITDSCNKTRTRRSVLETDPFVVPESPLLTEAPVPKTTESNETLPEAEPYRANHLYNKDRFGEFNSLVSSPNFLVGEAIDYNYDDDEEPSFSKRRRPFKNDNYDSYDDDDYGNYDDDAFPTDYEYGVPNYKQSSLFKMTNTHHNYSPTAIYGNNFDAVGSPSKYRKHKRRPHRVGSYDAQFYYPPDSYISPPINSPVNSYGVPLTFGEPTQRYGYPTDYGVPKVSHPVNNIPNSLEPIYMLTQSQLKNLIGQNNMFIKQLDVFQLNGSNKNAIRPTHRPLKHRKRYQNRKRNIYKNLQKIHKITGF